MSLSTCQRTSISHALPDPLCCPSSRARLYLSWRPSACFNPLHHCACSESLLTENRLFLTTQSCDPVSIMTSYFKPTVKLYNKMLIQLSRATSIKKKTNKQTAKLFVWHTLNCLLLEWHDVGDLNQRLIRNWSFFNLNNISDHVFTVDCVISFCLRWEEDNSLKFSNERPP